MNDHYYSAKPGAKHDLQSFATTLRGRQYTFLTDSGVFSRNRVDFGSQLLIETAKVRPGDIVLDLGAGYGPVGTCLASEVAQVHLVEVNERAAALATENLAKNGVTNASVHVGDGVAAAGEVVFDQILFNPPIRAGKVTVYRLLVESHAQLKVGGSLWVVVQTKQGAPSMKKELARLFGAVEDVAREAGYHIFQATKR